MINYRHLVSDEAAAHLIEKFDGSERHSLPKFTNITSRHDFSITNEANLISGECVGGEGVGLGEICGNSDDEGGDGDSDPDPEHTKPSRSKQKRDSGLAYGALPYEGFVRLPQVLAAFPISKSSWWAGCKSGRYPKSVKLGPRTTAWLACDIRALIEAQGGR